MMINLDNQSNHEESNECDLDVVYDYKAYPDKINGRCDRCNHALFESSVKNGVFIRKCRNCGVKKSI